MREGCKHTGSDASLCVERDNGNLRRQWVLPQEFFPPLICQVFQSLKITLKEKKKTINISVVHCAGRQGNDQAHQDKYLKDF
ncbi:Os12g0110150 [Oryza sativa Japonica Group]|uniref:Os12g0110150 protein n=1 Tax=Oryza sativa subsp. japonica TaxID=39947 RepID=A0A0P0Y6G1_ORYSJ|nr:Os12g0110150 [Oryza sativa Japonica Group]